MVGSRGAVVRRGVARGVLLMLLVLGVASACFSGWSAFVRYDIKGSAQHDVNDPLSMFVDTGGNTRAFRNAQFGAVTVDISETSHGLLFVKVTQQVVIRQKHFDADRDKLYLHLVGRVTDIIEARPYEAEVTEKNVVFLDGQDSQGTIAFTLPFRGSADLKANDGQAPVDVEMKGRLFTPSETTELDPNLPDSIRNGSTLTMTGDAIYYAGAAFLIEPPVVEHLDSWENLVQILWDPELGETFPMESQEDLEAGVSICDCAADRVRSDSETLLSTHDFQVIRWKYDEFNNLEFTQENRGLKIVTQASLWVLGGVIFALLMSFLPTATQGLFGIATTTRRDDAPPTRRELADFDQTSAKSTKSQQSAKRKGQGQIKKGKQSGNKKKSTKKKR